MESVEKNDWNNVRQVKIDGMILRTVVRPATMYGL